MDIAFIAKLICDLSLWFSASGFIYSFFSPAAMPVWPAGLMLLSCVLCSLLRNKKAPLRFLPLLALAGCAFWMRGAADILLLVPPGLYCAWVCVKGLFSPDYEGCCSYFKKSAVVLSLALLLIVLFGGGDRVEKYALPYFFAFLFSGILMLRLLRHDAQTRKDWRLWLVDLVSLVLCCAAALFFSSDLFLHAAGAAVSAAYRFVLQPLLMGIVYVFMGLVWVVSWVASLFGGERPVIENTFEGVMQALAPEQPETAQGGGGELLRQILTAVGIAALIVIGIVITFKIFRRMAEASGKAQEGKTNLTHREAVKAEKPRQPVRSVFSPRTPQETVRLCYRKFLHKVKSGGISLRPSDTSESIARSSAFLFDPALVSELRCIYIAARYSEETTTIGDAKRARELYGKLKTDAHAHK